MAEPINVLVLIPRAWEQNLAGEISGIMAQMRALDERITLRFMDYVDSDDVRTLRGRPPYDEARRKIVPPSDELCSALAAAHIIFALDLPFDMDRLAPDLRWVQSIGAGVGQLQSAGLEKRGVLLTSAAGVASDPIAEFVLARILAHWKLFPLYDRLQAACEWKPTFGRNLAGSAIGIVGFGAIGHAVARRAKAWGMRVLATRRRVTPETQDPSVDRFFSYDRLAELLAESDAVVLCAPETRETYGMFNDAAFSAMKKGSYFCNVARGSLVDEAALRRTLLSGHLAAAAIDVAAREPLPPDDPLWKTPNLFISPHSAASLERLFQAAWTLFYENMRRYLAGETLKNLCSPGYVG